MYSHMRHYCNHFDEIIRDFSLAHQFKRPMVEGSYPSFRVYKNHEDLVHSMLFEMGLDDRGNRFSEFSTGLPYQLSIGVTHDRQNESGFVRHYYSAIVFEKVVAAEAVQMLAKSLLEGMHILRTWDKPFLLANSVGVQIYK